MKTAILLAFSTTFAWADFKTAWDELPADSTPAAKEAFLKQNEKRFASDPDYWIACANLAWNRHQGIRIERGKAAPGDFALRQLDGAEEGRLTAGKPTAEDVDESIRHLDRALGLAENRIDIWRGRLDLLHWSGRSEQFLEEAGRFAAHAAARQKPFLTNTGAEVEESAQDTGTAALHDFVIEHFNAETKEGDEMIGKIANLLVKHFPKSVLGFNDLALYHDLGKRPGLVLENLAAAWKLAPADPIVALNYAEALGKADDKVTAKKVLTTLLESEELDAQRRRQAEQALAALDGTTLD